MSSFLITENELNETLLFSPYSMPNDPYKNGQGADGVKKYFYDFIRVLVEKINVHLGDIENGFYSLEQLCDAFNARQNNHDTSELSHQALITKIRGEVEGLARIVSEHIVSKEPHSGLADSLAELISNHEKNENAHQDIKKMLSEAVRVAEGAYNLAVGKSKVIPLTTVEDMLEYLDQNEIFVGDVFIFEEEGVPDFTYFGACDGVEGLINLTYEDLAEGEIAIKPGKVYSYEGKRLVASESGIDTSELASKNELDLAVGALAKEIEEGDTRLNTLEALVSGFEKRKNYETGALEEFTLNHNTEYDMGLMTSLSISLPEEIQEGFCAVVNFRSGNEATDFNCDPRVYFSGDDCLSGTLHPIPKRLYEINIKYVCSLLIAKVSGVDCEVI